MKRFLPFIFLFIGLGINKGYGQWQFNTGCVIPSGEVAYFAKPAPGFEIGGCSGYIENKYRFGVNIGYFNFKPTQDTFRTCSYVNTNGSLQIEPDFTVIHRFSEVSIGLRNEYAPLGKKKFSPVIGCDIYIYLVMVDENGESGDMGLALALQPRLGLQYKLSRWFLLTGEVARSMNFYTDDINIHLSFWKVFVGIKYFAN